MLDIVGEQFAVSLESNGLGTGEIKHRREAEMLLATRDNRREALKKGLNPLA